LFKGDETGRDRIRERGIWGTPSTADLGNIAPRPCDEKDESRRCQAEKEMNVKSCRKAEDEDEKD